MIVNGIGQTSDSFEAIYTKTEATGLSPLTFDGHGAPIQYEISGNLNQNGTPTPTSPIYPQETGDLVTTGEHTGEYVIPLNLSGTTQNLYLSKPIRKIGDYADEVKSDGTVIRRIKKLVLTGAETIELQSTNTYGIANFWFYGLVSGLEQDNQTVCLSSHFTQTYLPIVDVTSPCFSVNTTSKSLYLKVVASDIPTVTDMKAYLASQYANGTPVTIWYVLAEDQTETITSPALTPTARNNTLTVNTTLAPSNVHVHGEYEIAEIYSGIDYQNPIYYKIRTISGTSSVSFSAYPQPLAEYEIAGNMVQSGTPTPTDPIYPEECGDFVTTGEHVGEYVIQIDINGVTQNLYLDEPIRKIGNHDDKAKSDNSAGRKIKKLVLTGEETITSYRESDIEPGTFVFVYKYIDIDMSDCINFNYGMMNINYPQYISSHFIRRSTPDKQVVTRYYSLKNGEIGANSIDPNATTYNSYIVFATSDATTASEFKSFLASEYAAGHPVTIWYVLGTGTTETITSPTLIPTAGNNTLSVGTTLQSSNVSITGHIKSTT